MLREEGVHAFRLTYHGFIGEILSDSEGLVHSSWRAHGKLKLSESALPQVAHQGDHRAVRYVPLGGEFEPYVPVRAEEVVEDSLTVAGFDRLQDYCGVCRVRNLDEGVGIRGRDPK